MSMQDPIADMFTRIRNAQMVAMDQVTIPASKIKEAIAKVLLEEGYILDYNIEDADNKPQLVVTLKYFDEKPVIAELTRASRPGLRKYTSVADMPVVKEGLGVAIISTPKGVMTGRNASRQNLGGEVLGFVA